MKLKVVPVLALLFTSTLLVSCEKDDDVSIPTTSSKLIRTFELTNPTGEVKIKYTRDSLNTTAILDEEELMFLIDTDGSTDQDLLSLTLDKAVLEAPLEDYYTIESSLNDDAGDVTVIYTYDSPVGGGSMYLSFADHMNGQLVITDYNAQKETISGTYDITINNVADPDATSPESERRANIKLKGEFKNIKIIE